MSWYFIPPLTPHYNGMSESAVKSVKTRLKTVMGINALTYEEFNTLLVRIEGILNSRPLYRMSQKEDVLTPAHFLVGRSLIAPPENKNYVPRTTMEQHYDEVEKRAKQFWEIWKHDYLFSLAKRTKWTGISKNLKEGDLVLIRDLSTKKMQSWPKGLVVKATPNHDGIVRKVHVRIPEKYFDDADLNATQKFRIRECSVNHLVPLYPEVEGEPDEPWDRMKNFTIRYGGFHEISEKASNCEVKEKLTQPEDTPDHRITRGMKRRQEQQASTHHSQQ
ncbi:uncharacterized protein LOC134828803 [Culicoides brevitarsis]|uniref:uncharacterized protein LOC134828803 n=1 Tax=Culicoides brevitarsis TaxID=469753 RepID=UPI00307B53E5